MPTFFCWDNIDRACGGGSVHITPDIAFQEKVIGSQLHDTNLNLNKSKRRSLTLPEAKPVVITKINPKANPILLKPYEQSIESQTGQDENILTLWKLFRYGSRNLQNCPRFVGFVINLYQKYREPTVMTYLPPVETPITEYATLTSLFSVSREYAKKSNMKYVHITFDVGAAIKAYRVIWNDSDLWNDIIIHLGDFHAMMAFFGAWEPMSEVVDLKKLHTRLAYAHQGLSCSTFRKTLQQMLVGT